MPEIIFRTERLKVIEYTYDRLEEIQELYQDKEIIKYTLNNSVPKTKDELEKGIEMYQKVYVKYNNQQGKWLVVHREKDNVMGFVGLLFIDELQKTEMSYGFMKKYRGYGYATEAVCGLKKYVFEKIKLKELCALIKADNVKSRGVVERVGLENQNKNVKVKGYMFDLYSSQK